MIQKKLFDIFCEAEDIEKTGINEGHNYTFIKESSVKKMAKDLFKKHRVLAIYQVTSTSQMLNNCTQVSISYNFTDIDDQSSIQGVWQGVGYRGDKGVFKAITGSIKSCLIHNLGITSGEDGDEETKEIPVKPDIVTQLEEAIEKKETPFNDSMADVSISEFAQNQINNRKQSAKKKRGPKPKNTEPVITPKEEGALIPEPIEPKESVFDDPAMSGILKENGFTEENKSFF